MKNASLFLNFLKVFFKEKKKRSGCEEKIDKKMKNKEGLSRAWRRAGSIYAERWGRAIAFCIFRVEKRAVPLGRKTAL